MKIKCLSEDVNLFLKIRITLYAQNFTMNVIAEVAEWGGQHTPADDNHIHAEIANNMSLHILKITYYCNNLILSPISFNNFDVLRNMSAMSKIE